MHLIIVCNRPGLIRGGVRHPQAAEYDLGAFSAAKLRDMLAEPELTLVVGTRLTLADVDEADGLGEGEVSGATLDAAVMRLERSMAPRFTAAVALRTDHLSEADLATLREQFSRSDTGAQIIQGEGFMQFARGHDAAIGADKTIAGPVVPAQPEATVIDTEGTRRPVGMASTLVETDPAADPPPADTRPMQNEVDDDAQTHGQAPAAAAAAHPAPAAAKKPRR